MTTIGFTGSIGYGKTTASNYLKNRGDDWESYAFADPLKQIAIIMGFDHKDVYGTQKDKLKINPDIGVSGREFMQKFGTEIGRDILPEVIPNMNIKNGTLWTNIYKKKRSTTKKNMIIEDVRFINEVNAIKETQGIIIKIIKSTDINICSHMSEMGIDDEYCDFIINNNGSKDKFFKQIDDIVDSLERKAV